MSSPQHPSHAAGVGATRRDLLRGAGAAGLMAFLARAGLARGRALGDGAVAPHFPPRVDRVVFLHMAGGPSQIDLFDPKPKLKELDGKTVRPDAIAGERFAFTKAAPKVLASPYAFRKHGECGMDVSELMPFTARIADRLCWIRSMQTDSFNHAPAQLFLHTGHTLPGRPSMGSWVRYARGTDDPDLPGFTVLTSGGGVPSAGHAVWSAGFMPTEYDGVHLRPGAEPLLFGRDPAGVDRATRRRTLDALRRLNRLHAQEVGDPEIDARVQAYELAYRMQESIPEVMDLASEPDHVREAYGVTDAPSYANNCLVARRLLERGVRFVQLYHRGWDSHGTSRRDDIVEALPRRCLETDRASAALVEDLARRGMLDRTLVVWGGEFGRTPLNEEREGSSFLGRDHHPRAFTMWLVGGGFRPGHIHGETDELGYWTVKDPIHVHELQATILQQLGLDHERVTWTHKGREFRLTDVHGRVATELLA